MSSMESSGATSCGETCSRKRKQDEEDSDDGGLVDPLFDADGKATFPQPEGSFSYHRGDIFMYVFLANPDEIFVYRLVNHFWVKVDVHWTRIQETMEVFLNYGEEDLRHADFQTLFNVQFNQILLRGRMFLKQFVGQRVVEASESEQLLHML